MHVRILLVRIIPRIAEHLGLGLQLCVDLKTYCGDVPAHGLEPTLALAGELGLGGLRKLLGEPVGERFEEVRIGHGKQEYFLAGGTRKLFNSL